MDTLREVLPDLVERISSTSNDKSKPSSMLSKLSVRKPGRPSSLAESTSSRETTQGGLRLASRASRAAAS